MATDVEDRLTTLEARIKELQEQQAANTELRRIGIENGSQGVRGSLYLFAFIFTLNAAYAHFSSDKRLLGTTDLLWFAGILGFALVAYFGFIFRYTLGAKVGNGNVSVGTGIAGQLPESH